MHREESTLDLEVIHEAQEEYTCGGEEEGDGANKGWGLDQFPCWEGGGSDWDDGINVINGVGVGVGVGVLAMTYSQ